MKETKKGGLEKLILGAVIGAAVGSVVGAGISSRRTQNQQNKLSEPIAVDKSAKKPKNAFVRALRAVRQHLRNKNAKKK